MCVCVCVFSMHFLYVFRIEMLMGPGTPRAWNPDPRNKYWNKSRKLGASNGQRLPLPMSSTANIYGMWRNLVIRGLQLGWLADLQTDQAGRLRTFSMSDVTLRFTSVSAACSYQYATLPYLKLSLYIWVLQEQLLYTVTAQTQASVQWQLTWQHGNG